MGSYDEVELVLGKEDEELDCDGLMKMPRCYSKVSTNDKVSPGDHLNAAGYPLARTMMTMMRPGETPHQQSARLLLYTAHLLKHFSDASFLFSIAVFLASCTFGGSPMRLVSLYGLATTLAVISFERVVGCAH